MGKINLTLLFFVFSVCFFVLADIIADGDIMIAKVRQIKANGENYFEISNSSGVLYYARTAWMNMKRTCTLMLRLNCLRQLPTISLTLMKKKTRLFYTEQKDTQREYISRLYTVIISTLKLYTS